MTNHSEAQALWDVAVIASRIAGKYEEVDAQVWPKAYVPLWLVQDLANAVDALATAIADGDA